MSIKTFQIIARTKCHVRGHERNTQTMHGSIYIFLLKYTTLIRVTWTVHYKNSPLFNQILYSLGTMIFDIF